MKICNWNYNMFIKCVYVVEVCCILNMVLYKLLCYIVEILNYTINIANLHCKYVGYPKPLI